MGCGASSPQAEGHQPRSAPVKAKPAGGAPARKQAWTNSTKPVSTSAQRQPKHTTPQKTTTAEPPQEVTPAPAPAPAVQSVPKNQSGNNDVIAGNRAARPQFQVQAPQQPAPAPVQQQQAPPSALPNQVIEGEGLQPPDIKNIEDDVGEETPPVDWDVETCYKYAALQAKKPGNRCFLLLASRIWAEHITGGVLVDLDDDIIKDFGITSKLERVKILAEIKRLKDRTHTPLPSAPASPSRAASALEPPPELTRPLTETPAVAHEMGIVPAGCTDLEKYLFPRPSYTKPYKLFMSHRGPDTKHQIVKPCVYILERLLPGITIFFDQAAGAIELGQNNGEQMGAAVFGCEMGLVFLSPTFHKSKWCLRELNSLLQRSKDEGVERVAPIYYQVRIEDPMYATLKSRSSILKDENVGMGDFIVYKLIPNILSLPCLKGLVEKHHPNGVPARLVCSSLNEYMRQPSVTTYPGMRPTPAPEDQLKEVECYENQREFPFIGWSYKMIERAKWTDKDGNRVDFDQLDVAPKGCIWKDKSWKQEDWMYAFDWPRSGLNYAWKTTSSSCWVRRRRWYRKAQVE